MARQDKWVLIAVTGLALLWQPVCAQENTGRSGSWRKESQGAPDLKAARKRVEKEPKNAEALNDLGYALRQNGKLDEAEKNLKEAIALAPNMGQAHCNLSVVYFDQNKFEDALKSAQDAVKIDANNAIFRLVLGNAMSKSGNLAGAEQEYRVALHLKSDYENAHYHLGRVLMEQGKENDARFSLAEALKLDPNDDRVLKLLDGLQVSGTSASEASKAAKPAPTKSQGKTAESK